MSIEPTVSREGVKAASGIVSCVKSATETATQDYDAREIVESIRTDKHFKLRERIENIRQEFARVIATTGNDRKAAKNAVNEEKKQLPAVMWSGSFRSRRKDAIVQHSGLLCADLDELGDRLVEVRAKLKESPHLWAMFISPTGDGVKCVFHVSADADKHKASFHAVDKHVRDLTGIQIDQACSDVARLCFLSSDPDAYLNEEAIELPPLEADKPTPPAAAALCGPEIKARQNIAGELLGQIDWKTEARGFCTCPGERLHTTGDGERDCEVYLDKVPTIYCFHNHCRGILDGINCELRSRIGKAERDAKVWVPANDLDRAKALVEETDGKFRFITDLGKSGKWVHWGADHWELDNSGARLQGCINNLLEKWKAEAERLKQNVITLPLAAQAAALKIADAVKHLAELARSRAAIDNMIALAKKEPGVAASIKDFDSDPWFFGVQNGVINLKTGNFRPAQPDDMILKKGDVIFDPAAACPKFEEFLAQILPNPKIREFLWRFFGYCLTGETTEQVLPFLFGQGANGKSTLTSVIEPIYGDYAWRTSAKLFLSDKMGNDKANMVANLQQCRLVIGAEMPCTAALDEALIKDLTGGEKLMARRLFNEAFNFHPTHKLFFYGNHQPRIRGTDEGIWRRILQIPFDVRIAEDKRDFKIVERLLREKSGILNRMLKGCLDWQKDGLQVPDSIRASTKEYQEQEDQIGQFIADECKMSGEISRSNLMQRYNVWCEVQGIKHGFSARTVADRLRKIPGVKSVDKYVNRVKVRTWEGISLNETTESRF
jgi:P4 family phage/plasmid primase-like protien